MTKEVQVLFLDDEGSIINGIERLFARESYGVTGTTSPERAREILAQENIKVVISDHRMPEVLGVQFLKEVKEKYPDIIRILFTGYTDFTAAEEAINIGEVYRFISKPWKTAELLATIRQSIEHYDLVQEAKSSRKELEASHKKLKAMYEAQKEFTSTISHELRTPLASIKMGIDLILKQVAGQINEQQGDILGRAKGDVDRLKRLINDILDLTKLESGRLQMHFMAHNINNVIKDAVEAQQDVASAKGLFLKMELDAGLPLVSLDRDRILQVMTNLLSNALKFTHQGGITVASVNQAPHNHVIVKVTDTGKGIAPEDLAKLFEKFQQLEPPETNEEGGTGLGLAISRQIIDRHGGKIWAESTFGEGTTFSFVLPIQERRKANHDRP